MAMRILRIVLGTVVFLAIFLVYSVLSESPLVWIEVILISVLNSLGMEFIVPRIVAWGKAKGWISSK
jgi:hypothetical protein